MVLLLLSFSTLSHTSSNSSNGELDPTKDLALDGTTSALVHENGTAYRRRRQNRKDDDKTSPSSRPLLSSDFPNDSDDELNKELDTKLALMSSNPNEIRNGHRGSVDRKNSYTNQNMYENYQGQSNGVDSGRRGSGEDRPHPKKRASISKKGNLRGDAHDGLPLDKSAMTSPNGDAQNLQSPPVIAHQPDTRSSSSAGGDMSDGNTTIARQHPPPSPPLPPPPPPQQPEAENENSLPQTYSIININNPPPPPPFIPPEYTDARSFEPVTLDDSPELPSSLASSGHPPNFNDLNDVTGSPGGISKLSNEHLSSPDRSSILSDGSAAMARPYYHQQQQQPPQVQHQQQQPHQSSYGDKRPSIDSNSSSSKARSKSSPPRDRRVSTNNAVDPSFAKNPFIDDTATSQRHRNGTSQEQTVQPARRKSKGDLPMSSKREEDNDVDSRRSIHEDIQGNSMGVDFMGKETSF